MDLEKIADIKTLHPQYVVDDNGKKTAVLLSLTKFNELLDKTSHLAKMVDNLERTITQQSQKKMAVQTVAQPGETSEQSFDLLKQHYNLLNNLLGDLREYENLGSKLDRKLQLQRMVTTLDTEVQNLRNQLGEVKKQTKPATLHHVPELPETVVKNVSLFKEMKNQLLAKAAEQRAPLILQAPSGMGKSVMASTLAQDTEVRLAFPDGIFWYHLGAEADLLALQVALLQGLGEQKTDIFEVEEGTERLREVCATRACLVILDDVWDAQDILAFNMSGEHCQLLITTCDGKLLEILQYFLTIAKGYKLQAFTEKQASEFFINSVNQEGVTVSSVPIYMEDVAHACDYSPLALKLMASVARTQPPSKWSSLLERLQEDDYEFPDKYPRSLMQILHLNVEALGEPADYYLALAVFADYSRIPQSVVLMLWRYLYQLLDEEANSFIKELADKGLLQLTESSSKKYLSLHSFQYDYLCAEADLEKLHGHLLATYRRQCDQHGWVSGPCDGYFFEYLCLHLHNAGRDSELKLLLFDFDWMQKKLQATSIYALLNDYEWLEDKTLGSIKTTLYEAAPVLLTDKQDLPTQLLDRLWGNKPLRKNKEIQALLNQAQEAAPNWKWQPHFPEEKKKV